ncbi:MAG: alpha/beta hydrolase [Cellulomonadaceae bacterium]
MTAASDEDHAATGAPHERGDAAPDGRTATDPVAAPGWVSRRLARHVAGLSTAGLAVALVLGLLSLTPSLLPRGPLVQGAFTGLCVISGYAVGVLVGWMLRSLRALDRVTPSARTTARRVLGAVALVSVVVVLWFSSGWQNEVRALLDMPAAPRWPVVAVPFVAVLLAWPLLQLARGLRWSARRLTDLVARRVPRPIATVVGVGVVAWLSVSVISGFLWSSLIDGLNSAFAAANAGFDDGSEPPEQPERSGSAASTSSWESLGLQGRRFVTGGASTEQLAAFVETVPSGASGTPQDVREPVRVYAGLDPDDDFDASAAVVVDELERTNAWERQVLLVVTTTGTGWVDSAMVDSLELMYGGDTAVATMQYSNLPSWLSFIGDQATPPAAGRALFEAVYAAWDAQPEDDRPRLLVSGISLGSFGAQGAFSGAQDLLARADGALFVGTPSFTPLWREVTAARDPGSTEQSPVVDGGRTVRFLTGPPGTDGDPWSLGEDWPQPRVVAAQHASDGVTWWSPTLLWSAPDWLREPRGEDVHPMTRWYPIVTFWQLTADLFFAGDSAIPTGHGHHFELEYADGFAAVLPPEGWTRQDTEVLREVVAHRFEIAAGWPLTTR